MSWAVEVLDRETGRFLNSPETCHPIKLRWDDLYGPDLALIRCPCDQLSLVDWRERLGQDVRVYDPRGRLAWWGYLERVDFHRAALHQSVGLDGLANRVAVRFMDLDSHEPDKFIQTAWFEDLESQAVYGIKEAVVQTGYLFSASAQQMAAMRLRQAAWPNIRVEPSEKTQEQETAGYYLHCRGWMRSLKWRVWPGVSAVIRHAPSQQGLQALGNSQLNRRLAQSFVVSDSLLFNRMAVRIRKQGNPADSLRLSLQPDIRGLPSGLEIGFELLNASQISVESYRWMDVILPKPVSLTAGGVYWLVLERSGANSAVNHYLLGLDENQGYFDGCMLIYDQSTPTWKSRLPGADLLFRLSGVREQAEQMREVVDHAGQFLYGFEADIGQRLDLPPIGDEGQDCLQVFRFLLTQGNGALTPLCAGVDPNRKLQVWQRPEPASATQRLTRQGELQSRFGQALDAPWQAVGQWLLSDSAQSFYLSSLVLEPNTNRLVLNR